jgi:hypothetical protein
VITAIGLLFDIAGAWLLAYDLLHRLPRRVQADRIGGYISHLEAFMRDRDAQTDALPGSVYSDAEKEEIKKKEIHDIWDSVLEKRRETLLAITEKHEDSAYGYAWFGVFLMTVGFATQIFGALNVE